MRNLCDSCLRRYEKKQGVKENPDKEPLTMGEARLSNAGFIAHKRRNDGK